ncbi:hypothetical protein [Hymenobacter cheonanensis]|uniref:hypothetical protein n=1 Tax=Hymenobacter sp. CA2-7 TaxID=3063993 RepID=UPI002712DDBA|nr:hypothetical protein [Hymenobacter sp. CA2-7]MDO7887161.1 hypothetical protein [Hymenobacter sp. CA2-7]
MALFRSLQLPAKFHFTDPYFAGKSFRLLDIGAGNHSASVTKKWYPSCEYYGVALDKHYASDEQNFRLMPAGCAMSPEEQAGLRRHSGQLIHGNLHVLTYLLPALCNLLVRQRRTEPAGSTMRR